MQKVAALRRSPMGREEEAVVESHENDDDDKTEAAAEAVVASGGHASYGGGGQEDQRAQWPKRAMTVEWERTVAMSMMVPVVMMPSTLIFVSSRQLHF